MYTVTLNTGRLMPALGLGLYLMQDRQECVDAVRAALDVGYRQFDSAQMYQNEAYLGEALRTSRVPRSAQFVTTKIANDNQLPGRLIASFERSLQQFGFDYVDLLLLHFPVTGHRQAAWPLLEQIHASGQAKSIGVSNYTIDHLEELLDTCHITPAVNQVELHVYLQQTELLEYCHNRGIVVQAYSPLAHGHGLDHPVLAKVAHKHNKTSAQVMIRWCLEAGAVPLPKSSSTERIRQNFDVWDWSLDHDDLAKLRLLDRGLRTSWDPTEVR